MTHATRTDRFVEESRAALSRAARSTETGRGAWLTRAACWRRLAAVSRRMRDERALALLDEAAEHLGASLAEMPDVIEAYVSLAWEIDDATVFGDD
ncbi:hypothetical protein [Actinoalloteichus caeruleus]|uniref:Uncharacterized protein n=1 Tax=Actinoalloteichus caeruleus DSM 43889 TaxID=1120930 RepID=A0ABT1JE16_ACTCY|nr:hypothetical protein [Actinoalloteichus caeruleus]MCP2330741.1 hypothetical protein [Actinoalloteichus caeruleus DSM 43889]